MASTMTTTATRRPALSPWWLFGALLVLCWAVLLAHHGDQHAARADELLVLGGMWALMAVAMMAPTAVPVLASLRSVLANGRARSWWAFVAGYVVVWMLFSLVAAPAQWWLVGRGLLGQGGASKSRVLTASLLGVAGLYQLTSWKQRCLTECVSPMTFFLRYWREGPVGALRMGVRHGLTCVGCCWALMLLAFVGGVANVWFMVLSTALMALEKLPALGRRLSRPLGVVLLVAGGYVVLAPDPPEPHHHSIEADERGHNGQLVTRG